MKFGFSFEHHWNGIIPGTPFWDFLFHASQLVTPKHIYIQATVNGNRHTFYNIIIIDNYILYYIDNYIDNYYIIHMCI